MLLGTFGATNNQKVYICTGGKSECYHSNKNCKGLSRCSKEIKEISLDDAKKMGRRPCKMCCGN